MATKKNLLTIILVILISLNIAALAAIFFWHTGQVKVVRHTEIRHHKMAGDFLKDELNLTDEQNLQMDKLKVSHRDTLGFWAASMREKRNFLTMEMMKSEPNDSLLNATCDEIGVIYATIRKLNIVHYRDMKSMCNDEQRKRLDTVFKGIFCCDDAMLGRFDKMKNGGCGMKPHARQEGCAERGDN